MTSRLAKSKQSGCFVNQWSSDIIKGKKKKNQNITMVISFSEITFSVRLSLDALFKILTLSLQSNFTFPLPWFSPVSLTFLFPTRVYIWYKYYWFINLSKKKKKRLEKGHLNPAKITGLKVKWHLWYWWSCSSSQGNRAVPVNKAVKETLGPLWGLQ